MPNLPAHFSLALQAASRVSHPVIDGHLGSFLLGSTSPDIRIMTKWGRDQTHFAPLNFEGVGDGVEGLFQAHPRLADASKVNDRTKAFISGYFSHLVADESWIVEIYRSYFLGRQIIEDQVQANIWDRALQLEMDKAAREEHGGFEEVRSFLDGSESGVEVGFIDSETLGQWRTWVVDFTSWDFTWERLRFAARRMYRDNDEAMGMVEDFLQSVPASLEHVHNTIPEMKIASYQEKAVSETVRLIKEYLSVPEGN